MGQRHYGCPGEIREGFWTYHSKRPRKTVMGTSNARHIRLSVMKMKTCVFLLAMILNRHLIWVETSEHHNLLPRLCRQAGKV